MKHSTRVNWRLGWLLVGLIGLVILTGMPDRPRSNRPETGASLWMHALWHPHPQRVAELLDENADPDQSLDGLGTRPLHLLFAGEGCQRNQRPTADATVETLSLLLDSGADVNGKDAKGNSPLILAASRCDARIVSRLLDAGADPGHRNQRGLRALEMTLATASDAAEALLASGDRLTAEEYQRYREIYSDEPDVLALIERAAPDA